MSETDDIATQLGAVQSSLYSTIELEGHTYKIPLVNGLPSENMDLIKAGDAIDAFRKSPDGYSWEQIFNLFGTFGIAVLMKLNDNLSEDDARRLSVKKNVEKMYAIWGS